MKSIDQKDTDLIERYIDDQLNNEEEQNFLERLKTDKQFSEQYKFRLKIREDLLKAKQYEKISGLVSGSLENVKRKKRFHTMYAVAAVLAILVAIPGIFSVLNRNETNDFVEIDSTETEYYEPQMEEPENYANDGEYIEMELILSLVQTNDSVQFRWEPALENESKLVVVKQLDNAVVLEHNINQGEELITFSKDKFPSGSFIWYINGFAERDSFALK